MIGFTRAFAIDLLDRQTEFNQDDPPFFANDAEKISCSNADLAAGLINESWVLADVMAGVFDVSVPDDIIDAERFGVDRLEMMARR